MLKRRNHPVVQKLWCKIRTISQVAYSKQMHFQIFPWGQVAGMRIRLAVLCHGCKGRRPRPWPLWLMRFPSWKIPGWEPFIDDISSILGFFLTASPLSVPSSSNIPSSRQKLATPPPPLLTSFVNGPLDGRAHLYRALQRSSRQRGRRGKGEFTI